MQQYVAYKREKLKNDVKFYKFYQISLNLLHKKS